MTETLTDRFGRPAEVIQARVPEPRTVQCPWCLVRTTTRGHFFVGVFDDDRHAIPFCRRCVERRAPNLGKAVRGLNAIVEAAGLLGWRDLRKINNGLYFAMREALAGLPEELRRKQTKAARAAVDRATRAMIAREVHEVREISVVETVDVADPYSVIEALASIVANPIKRSGDAAAWLQEMFDWTGNDEGGER